MFGVGLLKAHITRRHPGPERHRNVWTLARIEIGVGGIRLTHICYIKHSNQAQALPKAAPGYLGAENIRLKNKNFEVPEYSFSHLILALEVKQIPFCSGSGARFGRQAATTPKRTSTKNACHI